MQDELLPVVQKAYDINRWLLPQVERFSRRYKFGIGARLQDTALDLCLALIEAGHARRPDGRTRRSIVRTGCSISSVFCFAWRAMSI